MHHTADQVGTTFSPLGVLIYFVFFHPRSITANTRVLAARRGGFFRCRRCIYGFLRQVLAHLRSLVLVVLHSASSPRSLHYTSVSQPVVRGTPEGHTIYFDLLENVYIQLCSIFLRLQNMFVNIGSTFHGLFLEVIEGRRLTDLFSEVG